MISLRNKDRNDDNDAVSADNGINYNKSPIGDKVGIVKYGFDTGIENATSSLKEGNDNLGNSESGLSMVRASPSKKMKPTPASEATVDHGELHDSQMVSSETEQQELKSIPVDEILDCVASRYSLTGGSALWMFNYKREKIERLLRYFCDQAHNRNEILSGAIGPTSQAATNYFFGSSRKEDGSTEYFLVSKRAVAILGEATSGTAFAGLYRFAKRLENPSFMGWVVQADSFHQVAAKVSI